ncbi:glycosyltransferase [Candidatus Uhrbacteria bacterium]|nr:glycosyltransferase [Candidatus Uhrbacteria bacterium]
MYLSIIIPTRNEEMYLPNLLKDIRRQSFADIEIIVADADSTDDTRDLAKRYRARVVKGGMPGVGRNRGARAADGDLLLFLDADVRLPSKHFLRDMLREMRARQFDLATCRLRPYEGRFADRVMLGIYNTYARATVTLNPHAPGACLFVKRYVHDELGGFDESITLAEDCDYAKRGSSIGTFGILKTFPVYISMRRHERFGRMRMASTYLRVESHLLRKKVIRDKKIPYDYDYPEKK